MSIKLQNCCRVFLKEKSRPHPTAAAHCVVVLATLHRQPRECVFVSVATWPVLKARSSKGMRCGPRNNKRRSTAQTVAGDSGWVLQCLFLCTAWRILQTRKILVMKKMFPSHHHISSICLSPGVAWIVFKVLQKGAYIIKAVTPTPWSMPHQGPWPHQIYSRHSCRSNGQGTVSARAVPVNLKCSWG